MPAARLFALLFALALAAAPGARAGDPIDPAFEAIVSSTTGQNHAEASARMQRWVDAHPGDPQAARGLLWMAQLARTDGDGARARPLLERVLREGPGTEWARHAEKLLADLDLDSHRYGRAIATYDRLALEPAPFWQYIGKSAGDDARSRRARFFALLGTLALLLSVGGSRLFRLGWGALWPIPSELAYALPLLVVILLASFAQERDESRAVIVLALGAMALLWINGAWLRAHPPRGAMRFAQALLGLAQALGLVYCAIIASGLWEKVVDTWQMGAD